ncbi:MAG: hypothetical protein IJA21_06065 [Clostridia bacterium]|nr:hypothetical protein [Clostridia bacterium]
MAKIFFTCNYYKNPARANTGRLLRYIGTRESVEKLPTGIDHSPSTVRQQRLIADIIKSFPHSKEYVEYENYNNSSTKSNATNFINAVIERDDVRHLDKLVSYIAERPGVEKLGTHGLFSQTDDKIDLDEVAEEVNAHKGIVFSHILSLHREDAERLGYNNAQAWKDLVRRNVCEIAEAHNISLSNLQWYAGFHNKDHHPHIHLMVYSKDGKQGWITRKTIEDMRRLFANDIFRNEQYKLFQMETQQRDLVKKKVKDIIEDTFIVYPASWELQNLFEILRQQLKNHSGKKVYGYLPKDIKETVNKIVAEFAKDEDVAELYAEWNKIYREKLSLYYEKKEPDIPLEDNKEFRSLKNDIIRAAIQMDNYLVNSGYSTEQKVSFLFTNVLRAFLKLFQNNYEKHANRLGRQVDRKLRSKIAQKKLALGIRPEQSDYENSYEQSM